jgi:hypothetical protein
LVWPKLPKCEPEEVLMITPPRPCACICRAAACAHQKLPFTCTSHTASNSSSLIFRKERSRRLPALLTSSSMPPKASTQAAISASAPAREAMLSPLATALPPAALISGNDRRGARRIDIVDHDRRAVRRQQPRVRAPDAAAGAGDHGALALEQPHAPNTPAAMRRSRYARSQYISCWCLARR